jgi:phosphoglycerol transferase MdoB-like AlkP superfamily enzyme
MEYFNFESFWHATQLIYTGIRYDLLLALIVNIPFGLLSLLSNTSSCERNIIKWWFIIPNALIILLNLIDVFYYPYIFKRINLSFFDYLGTHKNMGSLNTQFITEYWHGFLVLFFSLFVLIKSDRIVLVFRNALLYRNIRLNNWLMFGIILLLISNHYNPFDGILRSSEIDEKVTSPHQKAFVLNSGFNVLEQVIFPQKSSNQKLFFDTKVSVNQTVDSTTVKPNVVIILLESFAHEASAVLNKQLARSYMPFLDSLMNNSYTFTKAFANGRQSMDAIPAIWNGVPAREIPFVLSEPEKPLLGLPSVLKKVGYSTQFFHGAQNGSLDFERFSKQNGIDTYFGLNEYPFPKRDFDGTWGIWDEPYLQYVANTLDTLPKPFFSTVFTLSSHNPCVIPKRYEEKFKGGDLKIYKSIEYSDFALRRFFDAIKNKSWYKNSLFVIAADHSIHPNSKDYTSPENSFAIPLLFYSPSGKVKPKFDTRLAQQIDIFPSVLHLLNIQTEKTISIGNNLFNNQSPQEVINYYNGIFQFQTKDSTYYFHSSPSLITEKNEVTRSLEWYVSKKTGFQLQLISH